MDEEIKKLKDRIEILENAIQTIVDVAAQHEPGSGVFAYELCEALLKVKK